MTMAIRKQRISYNKEKMTYMVQPEEKKEHQTEIKITMENVLLDGGFTMIPNLLIENYRKIGLQDRHLIIILCLLKYAHVKRRPYPSQKTIAGITQKETRTIRRDIHELKIMGYITIYKRYYKEGGKNPKRISNVYSLKGLINKLNGLKG